MLRLIFIVILVFLMPAFVFQLAFDPVAFQFTSSWILQFVNLFSLALSFTLIFTSRQTQDIVRRCRPALFLVGIAYLSSLWSWNPGGTFRASHVVLSVTAFSLAMAARLSPKVCMKTILQAFILTCILSIMWAYLFPLEGIHQATDRVQSQHVGLWRGVMSHKQGLGVVAGLTTGFLLFYGTTFFSLLVALMAIACSAACLLGSGSVTGLITAMILPAMLSLTYWIVLSPRQARKGALQVLGGVLAVAYAAFHFGVLNFVMPLLGKSADLTGRADMWPWVISNINGSVPLLGAGFASGWEEQLAPTISIDNGYIEILGSFGYLGSAVIFGVYVWTLIGGIKMIRSSSRETARFDILPFNIMFIELFLNVTEASFLTKSINTVLICFAICHVVRFRMASQPRPAGARQPGGARQPSGLGRPGTLGQPKRGQAG